MALTKYKKNRQNIILLSFNNDIEKEYNTRITIKNNMISFTIDEFIDLYMSYQVSYISFNEKIFIPVNISYEPDRLILTCYLHELTETINIEDLEEDILLEEDIDQIRHIEDKKVFVSGNSKILMKKTGHLVNSFQKKNNMYISNKYNGTIKSVTNIKYTDQARQEHIRNNNDHIIYTRLKKHNDRIYTFIFPLEYIDMLSFTLNEQEFEILEIIENKNYLSVKCNKITSCKYYNVEYIDDKMHYKENEELTLQTLCIKIITNNQFINNIKNEQLFLSSTLSIEMNIKNDINSHFILLEYKNLDQIENKYIYQLQNKQYILCAVNKIEKSDYAKIVFSVMQNTMQWV